MKPEFKDAYFAGLIDGEGGIYLRKKGINGIRQYIQVNMTCHLTILSLQQHFGCGSVRPRKIEKGHRKPQWIWRVYGYNAINVCSRIFPYLITKRKDAEKLLAHTPKKEGGLAVNKNRY
jgi:hypothetical protein